MTPPEQWGLSDEGRLRCRPLAERLTEYDPGIVVTSTEMPAFVILSLPEYVLLEMVARVTESV